MLSHAPFCWPKKGLNQKDTTDMLKYAVTIEGHRVVALIDQFGLELSHFYIDGEFCDIYDPFIYNPVEG